MNSFLFWEKASIAHANAKLVQLDSDISKFLNSTEVIEGRELDIELETEVLFFELEKNIPEYIVFSIKEIISSLRDPLDQSICIIAKSVGVSQTKLEFPFGMNEEDFFRKLDKLRKLPPAFINIVRRARTFRGGNGALWALNRANTRFKHRAICSPAAALGTLCNSFLTVWNGLALTVGNRAGQHLCVEKRIDYKDYLNSWRGRPWASYGLSAMNCDTGLPYHFTNARLEYNGPYVANKLEFMTTTPGARVIHDFAAAFEIALSDELGVGVIPVVPFLREASAQVSEILVAFEQAAAECGLFGWN